MSGAVKAFFLPLPIIFCVKIGFSQTVTEAAVSDQDLIIEVWWNKALDDQGKFNFFNLNEVIYQWDEEQSEFTSYAILGYDWLKGFGPAIGYRFLGSQAAALGGVQYTYYTEAFFLTTNLTTEFKNDPNFEWFSIIQYRKELFGRKALFSQLQFSFNFNLDEHDFSFQRLRLGIDLGLIQTGFALNQTQFGKDFDYQVNPGLFFRLEFK